MKHCSTAIIWQWSATSTAAGIHRQLVAISDAGFQGVPDSFHRVFFRQLLPGTARRGRRWTPRAYTHSRRFSGGRMAHR